MNQKLDTFELAMAAAVGGAIFGACAAKGEPWFGLAAGALAFAWIMLGPVDAPGQIVAKT